MNFLKMGLDEKVGNHALPNLDFRDLDGNYVQRI